MGAINVEIAEPTAQTTHSVEAYIGPADGGTVNASLNGTINVGSSPITVQATSTTNQATAQAIALKAGVVTVGVEQPRVTVGGLDERARRRQFRDHVRRGERGRERPGQRRNRQFRQPRRRRGQRSGR